MARWIWEWNFFKDEPWISATTKNACETVMGTWSRILKTMKSDSVLERYSNTFMSQCRTSMPENIQILNLKNIYKKKKNNVAEKQKRRNLYVKRSHGKTGQNLRELEPPYKRETLQARWKGSFVEWGLSATFCGPNGILLYGKHSRKSPGQWRDFSAI